jgi:hypothetical protein
MDFSYRSYVGLLDHIRSLGRGIYPLRDAPATEPCVILRHDIDYSVLKAREMAEVEHRAGVRATVMVLLTSPFYNLLQVEHLAAVRDIASMGHEIGLHYDCDACLSADPQRQADEIVRIARFLEAYAGVSITSVAQHNPSMTKVRVSVAGYVDAYSQPYFKDMAYVSDSRRLFGAPDVYEFFRQHARSQLLIHPLWWFHEPVSRTKAFAAVRDAIGGDLDQRLSEIDSMMEAHERRLRGA